MTLSPAQAALSDFIGLMVKNVPVTIKNRYHGSDYDYNTQYFTLDFGTFDLKGYFDDHFTVIHTLLIRRKYWFERKFKYRIDLAPKDANIVKGFIRSWDADKEAAQKKAHEAASDKRALEMLALLKKLIDYDV